MTPLPPMRWTGEALEPLPAFAKRADAALVVGQVYRLQEIEDRSPATHRHYFASVANAHANLPEHLAERFPSPDHLRRYALIKAGFCDQRTFVAGSKAEAYRLAAFLRPIDGYAVVTVTDRTVTVYTAHSQSQTAMSKATFARSKDAVFDVLADMLGTDPTTLRHSEAA